VFYLQPVAGAGEHESVSSPTRLSAEDASWEDDLTRLTKEELRRRALMAPTTSVSTTERRRSAYQRSAAVRLYVLSRANGQCEACGAPAPFRTAAGRPYLEPHHTRRLADGGPDHPAHVIALCPNCHRQAHYAGDHVDFNAALIRSLGALE
jgi:5-methylcytosine-specific restriction protein A